MYPPDLPTEIWEMIISYLDGETLMNLRRLNHYWKNLVDETIKRNGHFKAYLKTEIAKCDLYDTTLKLYPRRTFQSNFNEQLYKNIYIVNLRWKNVNNFKFNVQKLEHSFFYIRALQTSANMIIVGDKRGVCMVNLIDTKFKVEFNLGEIARIEVYCNGKKSTDKQYFGHDEMDITLRNTTHRFFKVSTLTPIKEDNVFEDQIIRYWNGKKIIFPGRKSEKKHIVDMDVFENKVLVLSNKRIFQTDNVRTNIDLDGVRTWFTWHAKLVIFAKDKTLSIFWNGKTKTMIYDTFSPVTAICYYCSTLILGSKSGSVFFYRLQPDHIFYLDLEKYDNKVNVSRDPIVQINIIEEQNLKIILATDMHVFVLSAS